MYPTLKMFIEGVGAERITVVTGKKYLEQKVVRGGQTAEGDEAWKCVDNGELLFFSGIGLEQIVQDLLKIVQELEKKEAVLVLRLGGNIQEVPEELSLYCREHKLILLSMDVAVKLQPVIRKMYELLFQEEDRHRSTETMMKNLISGIYTNEDAENAYRLGLKADSAFVAVMVVVDNFFQVKETCGKEKFQELLKQIYNRLKYLLRLRHRDMHFASIETNDIVLLVQNEGHYLEKRYLQELFRSLMNFIEEDQKITISVGIGTPFLQLPEIRRSVTEARRALQIMQACGKKNSIRCYDDIGIYRLLFELQDQEVFQNIMNGIIGKLREFDLDNSENLVETLRIYLENDKNIGLSAQQMFLHRNTLKYRLNKIEEILLCDLSDSNTCFNLNLAFKIERFLQSEKMYFE